MNLKRLVLCMSVKVLLLVCVSSWSMAADEKAPDVRPPAGETSPTIDNWALESDKTVSEVQSPVGEVVKNHLGETVMIAQPPPAGQEASREWYLPQVSHDPGRIQHPGGFTSIGPAADPADVVVTPEGHLMHGIELTMTWEYNFRSLPKDPKKYANNCLVFALNDGKKLVPFGVGNQTKQSLMDRYLPIVFTDWTYNNIQVRETTYAEPLHGNSYSTGFESTLAWAAIDLTNSGPTVREISLCASQLGDAKQPKRDFAFADEVVMENGSALISVQAPSGYEIEFVPALGADGKPVEDSGSVDFLVNGGLYNVLSVKGKLQPGKTVRIIFNRVFHTPGHYYRSTETYPFAASFPDIYLWACDYDRPTVTAGELKSRSFDAGLRAAQDQWHKLARPVTRFNTPETTLNDIVAKAMLDGYILTKRWNGRVIACDSVCYRCQWDATAPMWLYALNVMGDHLTPERILDTIFERQGQRKPEATQTHEGCFTDPTNTKRDGSPASYAGCNGWALYTMAMQARFSNNPEWLEMHKKQILDGCEWIIRERNFSKKDADSPYYGLLSGKFGCDLPGGYGYFVFTDGLSHLGLKQMGLLLDEWGHPEGQDLLKEAEHYRRDIAAAFDRLTDKSRDPWFVPWILHEPKDENPYLWGSEGPMNLAYGGIFPRDNIYISNVIRWNLDHLHKGSVERSAVFHMFYSLNLACTLLELERVEEFLRIFYTLQAVNISHETNTTSEWRLLAQPHLHSISSLVRMFRTMMVQERDGGLFLLQGTPRRWLEQGKRIQIDQAPTWYGPVSIDCRSDIRDGVVRLHLVSPERLGARPIHLKLRLPNDLKIGKVTVNGQVCTDVNGEWIVFHEAPREADVIVQVVAR